MAIQTIAQLKAWFRKGLYPTEGQFADLIDSFRHKSEKVDLPDVDGLPEALNNKYDRSEAVQLEKEVVQCVREVGKISDEQENQGLAISKIHLTDEAQQGQINEALGDIAKIREMLKSGASLDAAKTALTALGVNYGSLYALASTVKTFLETNDTKDSTINTWQEIETFLQGISDADTLTALLLQLENRITEAYTEAIAAASTDAATLVEIKYGALVNLRDNAMLIPGMMYRITDYETTVANDPEARSAGHVFDLIVVATAAGTLSEKAAAIISDRDTDYFNGAKLEAWEVWYCLDNDTHRFQWADEVNGRGVIYRLIDEWGNDCPYDFKNIQFKRYNTAGAFVDTYTYSFWEDAMRYILSNGMEYLHSAEIGMTDENDYMWFYTFCCQDQTAPDGIRDVTLLNYFAGYDEGTQKIGAHNVIRPYYSTEIIDEYEISGQALNNIVLAAPDPSVVTILMSCNNWGDGCYNMTFHDDCAANTFGDYCFNIAAFAFLHNSLGTGCWGNLFGNRCEYNKLDKYCQYNTFATDSGYNTFGPYSQANSCGDMFNNNAFGPMCLGNSFGSGCSSNSFGDGFQSNTIGNEFYRNSGGSMFWYNIIEGSFIDNSFGNDIEHNRFGYMLHGNSFGNSICSNTFCDNIAGMRVGDSVNSVNVTGGIGGSTDTSVRNVHILEGTNGKSIAFTLGSKACQYAGLNSSGALKIWTPADQI